MARADGSLRGLLTQRSRIDELVIDDWATASLTEPERRDFWESPRTAGDSTANVTATWKRPESAATKLRDEQMPSPPMLNGR